MELTAVPDDYTLDANQQLGFQVGGDRPDKALVTFEGVKGLPLTGSINKDETVELLVKAKVVEVAFRGTERRHVVAVEHVELQRPER
jgi:hypothetical protein